MADVAMPRLSDSMEEGTILKWLKSDGDEVSEGEELVEIETDKANMTYEADDSGTLSIVAQEGDTLPVGETIAKIGEGGGIVRRRGEDESGDDDEPEAEADEDDGRLGRRRSRRRTTRTTRTSSDEDVRRRTTRTRTRTNRTTESEDDSDESRTTTSRSPRARTGA